MIDTWTPERVAQLQSHLNAGLTCSQIADEIGVSRNAVIGKIHRLGLAQARPSGASPRPRALPRPSRMTQRHILRVATAEGTSTTPMPAGAAGSAAAPVESAHRCSLLELAADKCRWPLSEPDADDFVFCGNDAIGGLSYCPGHARLAYRLHARRA